MKTHLLPSIGAATVIALSLACSHDEAPAATPTTTAIVITQVPASSSPGKPGSTIYFSDRLRAACGVTTIESLKEAPKFAFDQSVIGPADQDVLAQVAACLTTGPLKGRSVKLIGRADPRGTEGYNMALGERRSNAVVKYLGALGVAAPQLSETSRGALDAKGTNEDGWQEDRRVDIDLMEP